MRLALATLVAVGIVVGWAAPAAASRPIADRSIQQIPGVRPFQSAHFALAGTVKLDGVTIDVLGEGDLIPPDKQQAAFKFGPFTVELVMVGDAVYTRSRCERRWSRQFSPQPTTVGPISAADATRQPQNARAVGTEMVAGVQTEHYTADLGIGALLEPHLAAIEPDVRRVLETLEGSVDIWVGSQDRMIRQERLLLTVTLPSIEPDGDMMPASIDLTIAYSRLNQAVTITEPARNDESPIRSPRPDVVPVSGPPGSPASAGPGQAPARAPVQIPGR